MKDLLDKGAVIQRDKETYAIAPHLTGGLVTPEQLRKIADVADESSSGTGIVWHRGILSRDVYRE